MRKPSRKPPAHLPAVTEDGVELSWTPTTVLMAFCNPFNGCWIDLDAPLQVQDVVKALDEGREDCQAPFPLWTQLSQHSQPQLRRMHASKVAWFARHGFLQPIHVDVGVPSLGYYRSWLVEDGNHRLAAAVVRHTLLGEDPWLPLAISGSVEHARELGLMA